MTTAPSATVSEPYYPDDDSMHEVEIGMIGHAGPYFPYDPDDPRAPVKEKRAPGFVTAYDYVRGGIVRQYKRKRKP